MGEDPHHEDSVNRTRHRGHLVCITLACSFALHALACASRARQISYHPVPSEHQVESELDAIAEQYVRLVLALGIHDEGFVDSYFGPPEWRMEAEASALSTEDVDHQATLLLERLEQAMPGPADEPGRRRAQFLEGLLRAVRGRAQLLGGTRMTFDEESRVLYDAVLPPLDQADLDRLQAALDRQLPGGDELADRFVEWRNRFLVPIDRVDVVLRAAVDECRRRTAERIELPAAEGFTIEYVRGESWTGFAQYRGNYRSAVLINLDVKLDPVNLLQLGCHETYPGHHLQALLLDQHLVREAGWMEYTVVPLRSPLIFLHEGLADFGYDLALPLTDRIAFGRERLFPLAGLDPSMADEFFSVWDVYAKLLRMAVGQDAREFLEGRMSREETIAWLMKYALLSQEDAARLVDSYPEDGPYIINYGVGYKLVERYAESIGGTADRLDIRWRVLEEMLSAPWRPSEIEVTLSEGPTR